MALILLHPHHPPSSSLMSRTQPPASSSSNFRQIFDNALKAYQRRTKKDLQVHPLAAQLQTCDSPSSILAVLQQQVQDLNRSQSIDDRLTKWLDPTVNVLCSLSDALGESVGLVCSRTRMCDICILMLTLQVFSPAKAIFVGVGVLLSVCILPNAVTRAMLIPASHRQLKRFAQARRHWLISLNT